MFLLLAVMMGIYYFLLIRPQQKKIKEHKNMVENLRRGDQVITQGGILGKVTKVKEGNEIEIEIAQGVKVNFVKTTIHGVVSKTEPVTKE